MKATHKLMVAGEKYTDKEGKEKTKWTQLGVMLQGDGKISIKLETLPVNFDGWINCYAIEENQNQNQSNNQASNEGTPNNKAQEVADDLPF